uniref:Putative conserved secreted protein n=1 Tax=Ixodes scapularis TaxID=6945 RepID=A0A4D5RBM8_IXOSC
MMLATLLSLADNLVYTLFHNSLVNRGGYGSCDPVRMSERGTWQHVTGASVSPRQMQGPPTRTGCQMLRNQTNSDGRPLQQH